MAKPLLTQPLVFEPIFMERVWGGRRLQSLYGKHLPPAAPIGETWEIVDRPEAQSVVHDGPLRGATLHELWRERRAEIFGSVPDDPSSPRDESVRSADRTGSSRFPLLIKLLDAQENLSLQVHPPRSIAEKLGGESKTEFWYIANAAPHARVYAGVKKGTTRKSFLQALENGTVEEHVHAIEAATGDAIFLPSGRMHALGGGNVLVEIQENSDTTYRIYDWGREKTGSPPREMHIAEAMECVDFNDVEPGLSLPRGETLAQNEFFEVQKWNLSAPRELAPRGQFAISCCLTGKVRCGDVDLNPGEFFLIPASSADRELKAVEEGTTLLRITIPG
jgi:mannose-6-phosphate isomerase